MLQSSRSEARAIAREERPPRMVPTIRFKHLFRYQAASANGGIVTRQSMVEQLQVNIVAAGGANSYRILIAAIRLISVEMWGVVPTIGSAPNTISLQWNGSYSPSRLISDQSTGVTPAHLITRPPKDSFAKLWTICPVASSPPAETLFTLTGNTGDIVDVLAEVELFEENATTYSVATGAGTLGQLYGGSLDQYSSKVYRPVGWQIVP